MRLARRQTEALLWIAALALYVALIFFVSSRPHLHPPGRFPHADKAAHFGEYGVLGALARAAAGRLALFKPVGRSTLLAVVLFGLVVAVFDEIVQRFVPGRDTSLADLGADALGVLAGSTAVHLMGRRRRRPGGTPQAADAPAPPGGKAGS